MHRVINLNTKETFDSEFEAAKAYGTRPPYIRKACSGDWYRCCDCYWCYDYYDIDIDKEFDLAEKKYLEYKKSDVLQNKKIINITTNRIFDSINQASRFYDIALSSISGCINGRQKTTHGFEFMEYDKFLKYGKPPTLKKYKPKHLKVDNTPKPVINVDTQTVYRSLYQAQKETGINISNITECCRHNRPSADGYQWEFYIVGMDIETIPIRKPSIRPKKIIDVTTGIIYDSINQAAKRLNLDGFRISAVCKGKQNTTGGHTFKYYQNNGR